MTAESAARMAIQIPMLTSKLNVGESHEEEIEDHSRNQRINTPEEPELHMVSPFPQTRYEISPIETTPAGRARHSCQRCRSWMSGWPEAASEWTLRGFFPIFVRSQLQDPPMKITLIFCCVALLAFSGCIRTLAVSAVGGIADDGFEASRGKAIWILPNSPPGNLKLSRSC